VPQAKIDTSVLIPSGLTLLNCACSDNPLGAFALGRIATIPGASQGGKTLLMLNMLAQVATDPRFDEHELIYDDSEETMESFDIPHLFGLKLVKRIRAPFYDGDDPIHSNTIQDLKAYLLEKTKPGQPPFIYVADSLDALTTDEELTREYQNALIKAANPEAVEELKNSYKAEKAKGIGETLRMINGSLKKTQSALFIVQQVRAKFNAMKNARQWTTSGGKAPFFYSTHQAYLTKVKTHNPEIGKMKLKTGMRARIELIKNKLTGKERSIEVDAFVDYGMDDIGSCVDFLVKAGRWKKDKAKIVPEDLFGSAQQGEKFMRRELVKLIQTEQAGLEMQTLVGDTWLQVEEKFKTDRPRRFE